MKSLKSIIILSFAVVFILIGIHQSYTIGFLESYWLFMIAVLLLIFLKMNKGTSKGEEGKNKPY